jgi:hypothetical protein
MTDLDWTGYVGVVTGIVGMLTGISGMVTGYLGYRRSNQIKLLGLRLELRKECDDVRRALSTLRELLDYADCSRHRLLAATGYGGSGNMVKWEQAITTDRAEMNRLASSIRSETADFTALSAEQLESEIVITHKTKVDLEALITKCRDAVASDDDSRRQIAQVAQAGRWPSA